MTTQYRVTPKRGKWIVQRILDRKTCGKPFRLKTEALSYKFELDGKAPEQTSGIKVHAAYKYFVGWMKASSGPGKKLNKKSTDPYGYDYNLRISKYMEDKVLSDFKAKDMENYLTKAFDAGYPYKTLKRSVQFFKQFLNRQVIEEHNPCLDVLKFDVSSFNYILSKDQDLMFKPDVELIENEKLSKLFDLYIKEAPYIPDSATTFALFAILLHTGLRPGEILGLKKSAIDMENKLVHIKGVSNPAEGGWINKTKNRASKRPIELGEHGLVFFDWYLNYLDKHHKYNVNLFPSPVSDGPRGYQSCRKLIWKAYARVDLAKIEFVNNALQIESKFKGSPIKMLRHKFCNALIEAMNSSPLLTANYVKQSAGHSQISTTREIYGNKKVVGNQTLRDARAAAKEKALNVAIIPLPKLITIK